MVTVGSFNAKTHLPALLEQVAKGETIQITRRGIPVAKLIPIETSEPHNPKEAAQRIRQMRKNIRLGGLTIKALINEGRR